MRDVAGDCQHHVVVRCVHALDIGAHRAPERRSAVQIATASTSGPGVGAHPSIDEQLRKPADGPECSVPAGRCCPGSSARWRVPAAAARRTTWRLTEPTSGTQEWRQAQAAGAGLLRYRTIRPPPACKE